jgi:ABC-2 type transport system permease protein
MAGFSKKIGPGTNLLFLILIVLGFLVLINFLSLRHFTRFDLTQNAIYTLSASSQRIASELDDIVNIKCYFSKKLPPYVVSLKQQVKDMLDEYEAFAKGNVQVEFLDPAEDPALAQKMRFMGIPQVQMNILEKDQATSTNVYMGIAVRYEDQQQVIPFVRDVSNLEYELTSSILKVSREEKKTVGFLTGHNEKDVYAEYQNVRKALERQYEIEKVDTSEGTPILSRIDLLIVAGPGGLSERDKYELDQYIMRGGKVFFLIDIIDVPQGSMQASYRETNLKDLLENYGVRITKNLVLDRINSYISYQTGYTIVRAPYPFYPKIVKAGLDPNHPIVNQLESMMFPWVSALEVLKDTHDDLAFSVLAQSSEHSWLQKGMYNINPTQQFMPQPEDIKPYPVAVLVNGKFKSFYADKAIPSVQESDEEEETELKEEQEQKRETIKECAGETKILVVSNSRFLESNFTNQPGNLEFFLNAVDWFTWGKDLIGIRSRETTDRPLPILTERKKTGIRFANMMAVPLLVALFGVIRFYIRKRTKITLQNLK